MHLLEEGNLPSIVNDFYLTVYKWIPIVSMTQLEHTLAQPLWGLGSDMAVLLLAIKLIISRRPDAVEITQSPIYQTTKRFISLLEAAGTVSLLLLQANSIVAWYEYGQAIYPAAYMSAGWCVRYGNLIGINGHHGAPQLLALPVCREGIFISSTLTCRENAARTGRKAADLVECAYSG